MAGSPPFGRSASPLPSGLRVPVRAGTYTSWDAVGMPCQTREPRAVYQSLPPPTYPRRRKRLAAPPRAYRCSRDPAPRLCGGHRLTYGRAGRRSYAVCAGNAAGETRRRPSSHAPRGQWETSSGPATFKRQRHPSRPRLRPNRSPRRRPARSKASAVAAGGGPSPVAGCPTP